MSVEQLHQIQASLEHLSTQKRNFQAQLSEVEQALSEIGDQDTYKIIGNIMLKRTADQTRKDLAERQETLNVRIASLEKQESKLKEKFKEAQKGAMKEVKKK